MYWQHRKSTFRVTHRVTSGNVDETKSEATCYEIGFPFLLLKYE